jgi:3-oxoacid CoA-transferase subunit A
LRPTHAGGNRLFAAQFLEGLLEVEFTPQGHLARAPSLAVPESLPPTPRSRWSCGPKRPKTGVGTLVAEGKSVAAPMPWTMDEMAAIAAEELSEGY